MSLESYFAKSYSKGARTDNVYRPKVEIDIKNNVEFNAKIGGLEQNLMNIDDLIAWGATKEHRPYGIRSAMAEKLLGIVMESFLEQFSSKSKGIIRDSRGKIRRSDLVTRSTENYVLKMVGTGNFIILKAPKNEADSYNMEKFGYKPTEIDALAHIKYNNQKYLLIGETTTIRSFSLNSFNNGHKEGTPIDRIFTPLKELFPDHKLIYFVMAREEYMYSDNRKRRKLKVKPTQLHKQLFSEGIRTMFVPLPKTTPSLDQISNRMATHLPIIHQVFQEMGYTKELIKRKGYRTYPN